MQLLTRTIAFPESLDDVVIAEFYERVNLAIGSDAPVILVDCQAVEFMSSPGLMALVVTLKKVHQMGKKLFLCSVNEQVRMLLELTSTDQVFEILEVQDDGTSEFSALLAAR